jgi:transcriptional regulator with XRE-family HTH domain
MMGRLSAVRAMRLDAGLTLLDLFGRTRIQVSRLSLIERQLVEARDDEKTRIAKALGGSAAVLFPPTAAEQATATPDNAA